MMKSKLKKRPAATAALALAAALSWTGTGWNWATQEGTAWADPAPTTLPEPPAQPPIQSPKPDPMKPGKPETNPGRPDGKKEARRARPGDLSPRVGWMEISGQVREAPAGISIGPGGGGRPTLRKYVQTLEKIARTRSFLGVVIYLDQTEMGMSQVDELSQAIAKVRASGKKVLVFAEEYDLKGYLLACSADKILLLKHGGLEVGGIGIEEMYFAGLLEKVGAKADFMQVGEYKGADEQLTRTGPSPEWSQNFDKLLDDLYGQAKAKIGKSRKLDDAGVEKIFADSMALNDEELVNRKVVDYVVDRDLVGVTSDIYGDDFEWEDLGQDEQTQLPMDNPFALMQMLLNPPKKGTKRASIALIHAYGEINSGDSSNAEKRVGLMGGENIGSRTLDKILDDAKNDPLIKGIVIRIDSPGGSALASEVIWQAVREASKVKPVYISVGTLAASGGYYMATAGNKIYVAPASIVGSIGVVGGKIVLAGLYDKLGIKTFRRSRGPNGDMFNSTDPFTPDQRKVLAVAFKRTYEMFIDRVKTGRGDKLKDIDSVARGRLFTGRQAVENGMADKLGGVETVVADMAVDTGLKPGQYDVVDLPEPLSLQEAMERFMGGLTSQADGDSDHASAMLMQMARATIGETAWHSAAPVLRGMMLMRKEPVLVLMPEAIVVK